MLSIIAAMSENRVIGRGNQLPWHLPADLAHFKTLTMGHAIIMGRKTFESIGKALPGRTSIVLTRQQAFDVPGVITACNLNEALSHVTGEAFIIGGSEVFATALPMADRLHLTIVHTVIDDGDVYFPTFDRSQWRLTNETKRAADEKNAFDMTFQLWDRRGGD